MDKTNLLEQIKGITLYTGTYGKKKCTCSCIGCTQGNYKQKYEVYQGNIKQIKNIIKKLPNLEDVYILGNPDISVDTEFCNLAAKEFIKANKKVMFSTSGYNGIKTVKKLTKDIEAKDIKYISYSIDTINNEKLQMLKGTKNIKISQIDEAIQFCINNDITVKIQPTLWNINKDDYKEIIEHYLNLGIKWYTFHAGSFESITNKNIKLSHISPMKWREIVKDIDRIAKNKDLKIKIPKIFLDKIEYEKYKNQTNLNCKNGGEEIQIWLQGNGLKATFCPILAEVNSRYIFDLDATEINFIHNNKNLCSVCGKCLDKKVKDMSINKTGEYFKTKNEILYNVCRYYSIKRKYG